MPSPRPRFQLSRRTLLGGALAAGALSVVGAGSAAAAGVPLYQRCSFGAHAENEPYPNVYPHFGLESITGAGLLRMSWFVDVGHWPAAQAADAARTGHNLAIALDIKLNGRRLTMGEILAGSADRALRSFFGNVAAYPGTVTIRPFWEMNCNTSAWSVDHAGSLAGSVSQFRAAWRYLIQLQRAVGGSRTRWYFCVNGTDVGPTKMESYWPGADVVDEVGLDTYNDDWSPWADFADKVRPMYTRLTALDGNKPVSIGEIGCKPYGAPAGESKARWSEKMFTTLEFPRLRQVDFYNTNAGTDWRLQSSNDSLAVYQHYLPLAVDGKR